MLTYAPNSFMGVNYNSPTVQNMMQQQMMYQQQYSQVPNFGNINIGGNGYNNNDFGGNPFLQYMNSPQYNNMMNGGYYSGFYNYDPQAIRRQMEEERKAEEQRIRNNIEIQKMKARLYNTYYGIDTDEEWLEEYYNPATYSEINKDLQEYDEMKRLSDISNDHAHQLGNMGLTNSAIYNMAKISNQTREMHPVDQSFEDFMNTAGDLYREALINENARELRKNIGNSYNKDAYNQLVNAHRNSFASLRQNVSVDDLSISLPAHLRGDKEYQERKNQFLNYITQHDVRNRGGV